ncbi:MAG: DUF5606 domain-containing protein [Bacteroidales bacterium]|jgi:hypothetical protein|nr:DUF5606 domain-containing protein [Bacteroidales bacterium]
MEKTDLKRIVSVSGEHGLFRYLAHGKAGMIVESLENGKRTTLGAHARVSALGDISIFTLEEELPLKEVFRKMAAELAGGEALSAKADPKAIRAFFDKAVPDYDGDRFYVSHMKKVLEWYNCLRQYASLDFADDEEEKEEAK